VIYLILNFINFILSNLKDKIFQVIFVVFLILLVGLRYNVGTDWYEYEALYYQLNYQNLVQSKLGFLFSLVLVLFKSIGLNFIAFSFVLFSVSLLLFERTINSFSKNYFFSFFLYLNTVFLIFHINGIRQGLALSIIFYSIKYIFNNKKNKFLFSVLFASFFHLSAILFLPIYWLKKIEITKSRLFAIFIICLLTIHFNPFSVLVENIAVYLNIKNVVYYINNELFNPINLFDIQVLSRLIVFLIILLFFKNIKKNPYLFILFKIYLLGFITYSFFSFNQDISYRLAFYFKMFEIILLPNVAFEIKDQHNKYAFISIIFLIYVLTSFRIFELPGNGLTPFNHLLF
jgi:hypothetical protein